MSRRFVGHLNKLDDKEKLKLSKLIDGGLTTRQVWERTGINMEKIRAIHKEVKAWPKEYVSSLTVLPAPAKTQPSDSCESGPAS